MIVSLAKATSRFALERERSFEAKRFASGTGDRFDSSGDHWYQWRMTLNVSSTIPQDARTACDRWGCLCWIDLRAPSNKEIKGLSLKDAFIVGCGQAMALIPGVRGLVQLF